MFNKFVLAVVILASAPIHAGVVLYGFSNSDDCMIKNDVATKTVKMDSGKLSFSTTKKITTTGLEAYAQKAFAQARIEQGDTLGIKNIVEIDEVKAPLQFDDSSEARALIRFMREACN